NARRRPGPPITAFWPCEPAVRSSGSAGAGFQHDDLPLADGGRIPPGVPFARIDVEVHVEPVALAQPVSRDHGAEIGGGEILDDHDPRRKCLDVTINKG